MLSCIRRRYSEGEERKWTSFQHNPGKIIYIKNSERELLLLKYISEGNLDKRIFVMFFFDAYVVEKARDHEIVKPETAYIYL